MVGTTLAMGLIVLGSGTPSAAQGLEPLPYILEETSQVDLLTRCAGLFLSTVKWVGETRLGTENARNFENASVRFVEAAMIAQAEQDGIEQGSIAFIDLQNIMVDATKAMEEKYLFRYKTLFETSGLTLEEDGLWNADMDACAVVAGGLTDG